MTHATTSTEDLHSAMALLNDAAQKKRDEVRDLITGKYEDLRSVIADGAHASTGWIRHTGEAVAGTAKRAASTVNDSIHENPWPYIGSAALGALILGFWMGRRR